MSQTLPVASVGGAADSLAGSRPRFRWPNWSREPLLHFIVLGGLLFAGDHLLAVRAGDPRTIVVGPEVEAQARALFKASRARDPDTREAAALRQVWLDNEVLYREGIALQVDKGDPAIRERVIFKALSMIDAGVKLPPLDDTVLHRWFEAHRAKYDEPPRFDFEEATLVGDASESGARRLASMLNAGETGDPGAGLRVFKGRPRENLLQSYGPEFTQAIESAAPMRWQALQTQAGWRVVRLDRASPGRPAAFEALRTVVQQDWTDATLSEQRSAAVRAMAGKYVIRNGSAAK